MSGLKTALFLNFLSFKRAFLKLKEGDAMIIKPCSDINFSRFEEIKIFKGIFTPGSLSFSLNLESLEDNSWFSYQKETSDFLLKIIPRAVPQAPGSKIKIFFIMVDPARLELATSSMPSKRATNCAMGPFFFGVPGGNRTFI